MKTRAGGTPRWFSAMLTASALATGACSAPRGQTGASPSLVRGTPLTPPPTPQAQVTNTPQPGVAPEPTAVSPPPPGPREFFPGVRVDAAAKIVEFDAAVSPMLVPDPKAPVFYLEVIVCTPDTREHETLFVTRARPSHVHAAMLLIGLLPGEPGGWKLQDDRLIPVDPTGSRVSVRVHYDGADGSVEVDPLAWVVNVADGRSILERPGDDAGRPAPGWVFAGSRLVNRPGGDAAAAPVYDADESGTVVGLASFGAEVIAWSRTFSPDADVAAPEWVAKLDAIPAAQTPVRIRVRAEAGK